MSVIHTPYHGKDSIAGPTTADGIAQTQSGELVCSSSAMLRQALLGSWCCLACLCKADWRVVRQRVPGRAPQIDLLAYRP